ncbi:MAG: ABC transporter ATP-binding protein [Planctomycetaceae bacterium]
MLEVEELKKCFRAPDGEVTAVVDVPSFALAAGEQVALQGTSGSGKTTFLHLIAGILKADAGRIFVDGREMTALPEAGRDRLRANAIGYVFQTFNLLQGYSALENVLLGMAFSGRRDPARARALLERVGLGDRLDYKPRQLSVGQQQRVAVARALANRPRLVLADEPTGNLDRRHAAEALALVREVCREASAALLLVTHDSGAAGGFERVEHLEAINRATVGGAA